MPSVLLLMHLQPMLRVLVMLVIGADMTSLFRKEVTSEQENKAIDALKFKEELCGPHGVLLLGKLLDPNGNELEATDSTIIKLAQEQSEASLSYQDEIPWGVCRLLQLFQGTNYQDI